MLPLALLPDRRVKLSSILPVDWRYRNSYKNAFVVCGRRCGGDLEARQVDLQDVVGGRGYVSKENLTNQASTERMDLRLSKRCWIRNSKMFDNSGYKTSDIA